MTVSSRLTLVLLLAASAAAPASAQRTPWSATVSAGVVGRFVLTDNDSFQDPTFGTTTTSVSGPALALSGTVRYRPSPWVSADAVAAVTRLPVQFEHTAGTGTQRDHIGVVPLLLSVDLHPVHTPRLDVWVGPEVGLVVPLNDVSFAVPSLGTYTVQTKSTTSLKGFVLGAETRVGRGWDATAELRWQNADASEQLLLDPTLVTVGATHRF